jgi:hypothetical protein
MSTLFLCRTFTPSTPDPRRCAQVLGDLIQAARNIDGRPLEKIAPMAGLAVEDWLAIEAGGAADFCWEQMLLIGQVLGRGSSWMSYVTRFYKGAARKQ